MDTPDRVFDLVETKESQLNKIISMLKSCKRRDAFTWTPRLINHTDISITTLVNLCFKHSSFPEDWKCTIVTPKPGECLEAGNYSPISN